MAGSRCRVSFTDSESVLHAVDVDAESLYEALAIAVAQFRDDDSSRNLTEHKIRLGQVTKWAQHTTTEGSGGHNEA
jgi:hypothetical protein